jgi:hypothetical protein
MPPLSLIEAPSGLYYLNRWAARDFLNLNSN